VGRVTVVLVLGTCAVRVDDALVELSPVQRMLLTRLAIARPHAVPLDDLVDTVWASEPPATARASIHNQVSRIRSRVHHDAITTDGDRYRLELTTDAEEATDALSRAESLLQDGRPGSALDVAQAALELFRGPPLDDLDGPDAVPHRMRFAELQRALETVRLSAGVLDGRINWAVVEAERLVAATPHDEQRWSLLVRALHVAGRPGDALGAYDRARRAIAGGLGLPPGEALRAAEAAVLGRDPSTSPRSLHHPVVRKGLVDRVVALVEVGVNITLVGEAGIGKTSAMNGVFRQMAQRGTKVGRAEFVPQPGRATATLEDLLLDLQTEMDPQLPPVAAFTGAITTLAEEGPVLLCVDDIDYAGPTSLAALRAAAGVPLVVVLATSSVSGPIAWDEGQQLTVEPLTRAEVDELVEQLRGSALRRPLLDWVDTMSGGNPTLVEHLLDELGSDASPDSEDVSPPITSAGLHEVVRRRLSRVHPSISDALDVAAVCGPRFPELLLRSLASADGVDGALAEGLLLAGEAVTTDGTAPSRTLAFRHGAVQQVLESSLAPGRRIEIHHAAVAALERLDAPAAMIAVHAFAAAEIDRRDAIRWTSAAGVDASAIGAHAEAANWFEQAASVASTTDDRAGQVTAMIASADSLRMAGFPEQEVALFRAVDAATDLGDPDLMADATFALLQLGATTESGAIHERAVAAADRTLTIVRDPERRARVAAAAALAYSLTESSDRCRPLFLEAVSLASRDDTRRAILPFAFLALGHPSDLQQREELTAELIELAHRDDDPVAAFEGHQLAFSVAIQRSDGPRMRASLASLEALVPRVGDVGRRWAIHYHRAAVEHLDAKLDAAERSAETAMELFAPISPSRAFATYGGQLLPIRIAQGRLAELRRSIEALVADQPGVPAWRAALALAVVDEDRDRAADLTNSALADVAEDFTWLAAHVIGGRAASRAGSVPIIDRYLDRLQPWSGLVCWQGTCSYGPVDTVIAMLQEAAGRLELARAHAERAREQASRLGASVFEPELDALLDRIS